ncbi:uncharacterized protein An11g07110 [Aspergillus niger]|uniref:Contig An11c0240, genomic contig n=2 Tax=Aspergillus niger TaxID=5061 RepID=A2QX05_ASPNC|nr:uncharacterized protein An11g07110 [Aspergillus niger]CAK97007.1 unnamed protein product [Aspergillus niger]
MQGFSGSPMCESHVSQRVKKLAPNHRMDWDPRNNNPKPNKNDAICKPGSNGKGKWGFDVGEYAYAYDGHSYRKARGSK